MGVTAALAAPRLGDAVLVLGESLLGTGVGQPGDLGTGTATIPSLMPRVALIDRPSVQSV
jgi:hypothetical protein